MSVFEGLQFRNGNIVIELRKSPMILKLSLGGLLAPIFLMIFIIFLESDEKTQMEYLTIALSCAGFFILSLTTVANFIKFLDEEPGLTVNKDQIINNSRLLGKKCVVKWSDVKDIKKKFSIVEKAIIIKHSHGKTIINTSSLRANPNDVYEYLMKRHIS